MTMMLCVTGSTEMIALPTVPLLLYWPLPAVPCCCARTAATAAEATAKAAEPAKATAAAATELRVEFKRGAQKENQRRRRDIFCK